MSTTLLLLNPLVSPISASPEHPASISESAITRIRHLLRNSAANCARITRLLVNDADLARARSAAAEYGSNTEVLATAEVVIATAHGGQAHLRLELQCKSTGPVHVTTYDEWASLP
jgi:hypothetical protein